MGEESGKSEVEGSSARSGDLVVKFSTIFAVFSIFLLDEFGWDCDSLWYPLLLPHPLEKGVSLVIDVDISVLLFLKSQPKSKFYFYIKCFKPDMLPLLSFLII